MHILENLQKRHKNTLLLSPWAQVCALLVLLMIISAHPSKLQAFGSDRVVAVVNGAAVTSSDVNSHKKILSLTRQKSTETAARTAAIEALLKLQEAENRKVAASDEEVQKQIERIASGQKTTPDAFLKTIARKGILVSTYKKHLKAQIGWGRILRRDYGKRVNIDDASVKADYEKFKKQKRPGIKLAVLQPISLPFTKGSNRQLIQARVADAQRIASRLKSCRKLSTITDDIYNVRIGKRLETPLDKLNNKARAQLRKKGAGSVVSFSVNQKAGLIQMMAYCGNRTLRAKVPPYEQFKNGAFSRAMLQYSARHMKKVKDLAIIEIKGN